MSLFRCSGVINTATLDKESYAFFPNGLVTATKLFFFCLALYDFQSQIHNFQKAESENNISETSERVAQINTV